MAGGTLWNQGHDLSTAVVGMGPIADDSGPPRSFPTFWRRVPFWCLIFFCQLNHCRWTGRFSFWTCSSVDWFRSPERIKTSFVWPKPTEGHPLYPPLYERTSVGKQFTKSAFSLLCDRTLSWPPFAFKYPFFSSLPTMAVSSLLPYANACRVKESRCTRSKELWYFYGGWCWD